VSEHNDNQTFAADVRAYRQLLLLIYGYMPTFLISAALRLEIPDRLGDSTMTSEELATATQTHHPSLTRMLRAMAAVELMTEVEPGRFKLTPAGALLRADVPGSVQGQAKIMLDESMWRAWPALEHSVRTGERAFDHVFGTDYLTHTGYFNHLDKRSGLWDVINRSMIEDTQTAAVSIVQVYNFAAFSTIVDIGGGSGALSAAILAANPGLRGIVFDRSTGIEATPSILAAAGVTDRCEIRTGDFLTAVPEGGDLYMLKSVIFNWHDDHLAATILGNCRRVIPDDGRLLLVEQILPPQVDFTMPSHIYLYDVNSLVNLSGRQRTEAEYRALLVTAGFELVTIIPLSSGRTNYSLLEAAPS
jgi:orsellinic acid C2-O-methyltransferase